MNMDVENSTRWSVVELGMIADRTRKMVMTAALVGGVEGHIKRRQHNFQVRRK